MAMLYFVNSLVNGHLVLAWAMLLNWYATGTGNGWAVYGILFAALAYGCAWLSSSLCGVIMLGRERDTPDADTERHAANVRLFAHAAALFTVLSWLCYLLPALFR